MNLRITYRALSGTSNHIQVVATTIYPNQCKLTLKRTIPREASLPKEGAALELTVVCGVSNFSIISRVFPLLISVLQVNAEDMITLCLGFLLQMIE